MESEPIEAGPIRIEPIEVEPIESGSIESEPARANQTEPPRESLRLPSRRVNAYEAIRQADEEAEAIALEQAALIEQAQSAQATPARDEVRYPQGHPPLTPLSRTTAYPRSEHRQTTRSPDSAATSAPVQQPSFAQRQLSRLWPQRKNTETASRPLFQTPPFQTPLADAHGVASADGNVADAQAAQPPTANGRYVVDADGRLIFVRDQPSPPVWWKQQPYYAIAHLFALSGTLVTAWLFGILIAQIFPGNLSRPPLQESVLRKSSRFAKHLWHFPQLWQSQTTEIRIEAIPIPNTGLVVRPIALPPLERQPLIDELNAIETEVLTIDRRIEILEKQLGRPPYEGADISHRINSLRGAIDPPVNKPVKADYQPEPIDPSDRLLEVAERKITLPADALFNPGQSQIKDADTLNAVLDQLVNYPGARVVVRSYSDNQAGAADSREYTLAQANALSQYLQKALPEEYRWVTVGGGNSQALSANETAPERQRNRRIEILIDTR